MMTEPQSTPLLNDHSFEEHLKQIHTPWLADLKRRHFQDFTTLPMPGRRDEPWRFSRVRDLSTDGYQPVFNAPDQARAKFDTHIEIAPEVSARIAFVDNQLVLRGSELPDGVEIMTFAEALTRYPEDLQKSLSNRRAELGMDKFFALHMAFLSDGLFIRIKPNTVVEKPIEVHYLAMAEGALLTPHTIVHAAENSQATLIEYHGSLDQKHDADGLNIGVGTVTAGQNSTIRRILVQNHGLNKQVFQSEHIDCGRDAHIDSLQVNLGGRYARFEGHAVASGTGADVHLYSLAAPVGNQVFDQRTLQTHRAPHTRSDLLFKNALQDHSQTIFSGMIFVEEAAQQTDAYQTNRNLLLDPSAEANSLPGLEINANDVKCSHGATSGQVDPEELFYLLARGIPRKRALELLVFGFFEEILAKIENKEVHKHLSDMVTAKFTAS